MKKLLFLVVVVIGGFMGYNYLINGDLSPTEQQIVELQDALDAAAAQAGSAYRMASAGGLDTTADLEAAGLSVARIKKSLKSLQSKLDTEAAKKRAKRLATAIEEYERRFR